MPVFTDQHRHVEGLNAQTAADAHRRDLEIQDRHQVRFLYYWYNDHERSFYCHFEAPSKEAAEAVHREAHGLIADSITEVMHGD